MRVGKSKAVESPVCPCGEQVLEALVRLLGRAEAGEHAHRPELAAVHRRLDAAGERVLPGQPEVAQVVARGVGRGQHVGDVERRSRSRTAGLARRDARLGARDVARAAIRRPPRGCASSSPGDFAVGGVLRAARARRGTTLLGHERKVAPFGTRAARQPTARWRGSVGLRDGGGGAFGLVAAVDLERATTRSTPPRRRCRAAMTASNLCMKLFSGECSSSSSTPSSLPDVARAPRHHGQRADERVDVELRRGSSARRRPGTR